MKRKQRTEKQIGCVAIAIQKARDKARQIFTRNEVCPLEGWIDTISFVHMKINQLFRFRNLLLLVFVSCMNI